MNKIIKKYIIFFGFYFYKHLINHDTPIGIRKQKSINSSYEYFSKYFDSSVLFEDVEDLRIFAIESVLQDLDDDDLILEFGVFEGN